MLVAFPKKEARAIDFLSVHLTFAASTHYIGDSKMIGAASAALPTSSLGNITPQICAG